LRRTLLLVTAGLILLATSGCPLGPRTPRPNLLLITIDTLRADHLGTQGSELKATPRLDRLAREGRQFTRAYSATPITLPSHASILTGLNPPEHGVRHNGVYKLPAQIDTLAERLHAAGYQTAAVVGAYVLEAATGLDQGFDLYDAEMPKHSSGPTGYDERKASQVTQRASHVLSQMEEPFFLWVHYYDPHAEYAAPEPFAGRYPDHPYAGEVAYTDSEVGKLLDQLSESDLANTLVIATADHGESLGEHGEATHSYTLYDSAIAVPLIFRGPGVPVGTRVDALVSNVAITPTALSLLGLTAETAPAALDLSVHWGPTTAPAGRGVYSETLATKIDYGWAELYALRRGDWLYVDAPRPELYDRREDPKQLNNLLKDSEPFQDPVRELQAALSGMRSREGPKETRRLDPESLQRLQRLGYALPAEPVADRGDLDFAEKTLLELIEVMPESGKANRLLTRIRMHQGRWDRARHHAELAVRSMPGSAYEWEVLAVVRESQGDVEGAVEAYGRAGAINPDFSARTRVGLMWGAVRKGRIEDAAAHAARAQELTSEAAALERIGSIWEGTGEVDRALAAYRGALALDPDSKRGHMAEAIRLAIEGAPGDRVSPHLQAAGTVSEEPAYGNLLAFVYLRQGKLDSAETLLRAILRHHPTNAPARKNLTQLLLQQGRSVEAGLR
jgi:arylsulfatase A-like enzyme/Tfp pilus assembly protein PilF